MQDHVRDEVAHERRVLEAVAAPTEVGEQSLVRCNRAEDGVMVRRRVVEARVAPHREAVLHHREAMGDQLGVLHDLVRVGALVVRVRIDDLVVDQLAVDRQIPVLGAHVGHLDAVGHRRVHAEA